MKQKCPICKQEIICEGWGQHWDYEMSKKHAADQWEAQKKNKKQPRFIFEGTLISKAPSYRAKLTGTTLPIGRGTTYWPIIVFT